MLLPKRAVIGDLKGASATSDESRSAPEAGAEPLAEALDEAAIVTLAIAEGAADVAAVAAWAASAGAGDQRADAVVAATIAEASARGCAHLVLINLAVRDGDAFAKRATAAASAAMASREQALLLVD